MYLQKSHFKVWKLKNTKTKQDQNFSVCKFKIKKKTKKQTGFKRLIVGYSIEGKMKSLQNIYLRQNGFKSVKIRDFSLQIRTPLLENWLLLPCPSTPRIS